MSKIVSGLVSAIDETGVPPPWVHGAIVGQFRPEVQGIEDFHVRANLCAGTSQTQPESAARNTHL